MLRLARPSDATQILNIYGPYITNTSFTFETDMPSIDEFEQRIKDYLQLFPWLVYEVNGIIAGYAYAGKHRERTAYQWCAEASVYVHDDFQRMGIAQALYLALFDILQRQGVRNVYAVINLPNDKSVILHEMLGFNWFATYENVGYKLGKWKNVGWWKLAINPFIDQPGDIIKFPDLNLDFLTDLLEDKSKLARHH